MDQAGLVLLWEWVSYQVDVLRMFVYAGEADGLCQCCPQAKRACVFVLKDIDRT